jgi:hypothetical protein
VLYKLNKCPLKAYVLKTVTIGGIFKRQGLLRGSEVTGGMLLKGIWGSSPFLSLFCFLATVKWAALFHHKSHRANWPETESSEIVSQNKLVLPPPFSGNTCVWTQDFTLAEQALYQLSHSHSPFCFHCFSDRVSHFCLGWPQTTILLPKASCIAGITDTHHLTQIIW